MSTKHNKFMVGAVTAAMVATAVAPVAGAEVNPKSEFAFSDVSVENTHYENIYKAYEAEFMSGYQDGTFKPFQDLTRGNVVKALGKYVVATSGKELSDFDVSNVTPFSDVPATTADKELYNYSLIVKQAGIFSGSNNKLMPAQNITRQQMAKVLVNAFDLKDLPGDQSKVTDNNKAFAEFVPYINILSENGVTSESSFRPTETTVRGQFASFLVRAYEASTPVASTPAVASVSAINGKELQIQFNTAVDATDAQDLSNYRLTEGSTSVTFSTPVVSEDGKTVTLTPTTGVIDVTNATLEIDPIVTKADASVSTAKFVSLFTYTDNVAPTVASIKAQGEEAVVTFAEALTTAGTVSLDGVVISNTTSTTNPYYEVSGKTLTVKNLTNEQAYKLDIVGATDAAGNIAGQITTNFTVAKPVVDDSKPTVSTSVSGNKLTLSFSEEVAAGTVLVGGNSLTATTVSEDKKTYTYDVQAAGLLNGKTFITNEVQVSGFADTATPANTMNPVKFNATFTADTTAPKFASASIKTAANGTDDLILVTFDDAVYAGDLSGLGELVVTSIDGIYQSNTAINLDEATNIDFGYDLDGKDGIKGNEANVVAINFDSTEKSSYTFELAGEVVADKYGNEVASTINFSAVAPEFVAAPGDDLKDVTATVSAAANNTDLTVQFSDLMSNSALTASNYTLGGKALPTGTTLRFVDNKTKVVISLPQGSITANGSYVFTATNLRDLDGNSLANGKVSQTVSLSENVVPVATKVAVTSSNTFTVDFTESITSGTPTADTVIVKINGTTVTPAGYSLVNGDLTVTTAQNFALTDSITVEFKAADLVDTNGNKVKNGVVTK